MKSEEMLVLNNELKDCKACPALVECRQQVVKGYGELDSDIMIVGQNPSIHSGNITGRPLTDSFTGKALREIFDELGYDYDKTYRTNLVKCATVNNRIPNQVEIKNCARYLEKEISIVMPKVILTLGQIPASFFTDVETFTDIVGEVGKKKVNDVEIPVVFTHHPSHMKFGNKNYFNDIIRDNIKIMMEVLKGKMVPTKTVKAKAKTSPKEPKAPKEKKERVPKFDKAVLEEVVKMAKDGKSPAEISEHFKGHPNPNAVKRWCKKAGVETKAKAKAKKEEAK